MIELNKIYNADCMDILKQLPDKCIDLVLTDPPYGIKMAKNTNICSKTDYYGKNQKGFYVKELHKQKQWDNTRPDKIYFDEIVRVSKNQIIFGGNYFADYLKPARGWIFWDKKEHPTQKPLKLFEMILNDYSKEGDLILDCFSGSGTTAVACHNLKRNFICIEKDYDYWKASVERLENAQAQQKLF